ncbi:MAG: hypothetical protein HN341_11105 [Verrucomicrobia bacterium]|nr:hypothetical protein [Verrucomicrobiota bacterium]
MTEALGLDVGATVGYIAPDEGDDGFSHYTASVGLSYSVLTVGVTYVGQIDDEILADAVTAVAADEAAGVEGVEGVTGYDTEVVGTVGIALDF